MLDVLFYACMILIFAASVPIWRKIFSRRSSNQTIVEPRQQLSSPMGLVDLGGLLFFWLMAQVFAGILFTQIANVQLSDFESLTGGDMMLLMLIAGLAQLFACAIGLAWMIARYKDTRVIGWYPTQLFTDLKLALASFLIVAPIVLVAQTLLALLVEYKHPAMEAMIAGANWFTILAVWISAVIAAPIAEEIVFRGWIQNWLQRLSFRRGAFAKSITGGWWHERVETPLAPFSDATDDVETDVHIDSGSHTVSSPLTTGHQINDELSVPRDNWFAIVVTSLIFALMHLGQGLAPIPLFGLSILLGYLYQRTGSLLPCIGLHMLNNSYSVFWLTMQILFGETPDLP